MPPLQEALPYRLITMASRVRVAHQQAVCTGEDQHPARCELCSRFPKDTPCSSHPWRLGRGNTQIQCFRGVGWAGL